jgi:hypothetical protein
MLLKQLRWVGAIRVADTHRAVIEPFGATQSVDRQPLPGLPDALQVACPDVPAVNDPVYDSVGLGLRGTRTAQNCLLKTTVAVYLY